MVFLLVIISLVICLRLYLTEIAIYINYLLEKLESLKEISTIYCGEKLLEQSLELEVSSVKKNIYFYKYKFYSDLLERLLGLSRRYGANTSKVLKELRFGIAKDLRFEKKIKKIIGEGIYQFFLISLVTWMFIWQTKKWVNSFENSQVELIIGLMQVLGLIVYLVFVFIQKSNQFSIFNSYLDSVLTWRSLVKVGLGIQEIIQVAKIENNLKVKSSKFNFINNQMERSIALWKSHGKSPENELVKITDDLWFIHESILEIFCKRVEFIKFGVLAVFYLGAYLVFIFSLIGAVSSVNSMSF